MHHRPDNAYSRLTPLAKGLGCFDYRGQQFLEFLEGKERVKEQFLQGLFGVGWGRAFWAENFDKRGLPGSEAGNFRISVGRAIEDYGFGLVEVMGNGEVRREVEGVWEGVRGRDGGPLEIGVCKDVGTEIGYRRYAESQIEKNQIFKTRGMLDVDFLGWDFADLKGRVSNEEYEN